MLKEIRASGLGPLDPVKVELDPKGITRISGASELGKSFLLRAVCVALFGTDADGNRLPVEALSEGSDRAEVTVTTGKGSAITRTSTRKGSKTMTLHRAGEEDPERFKTADAFSEALGPLGDDRLRLAMVPLAWRSLATGNARPLRDFLSGILPEVDVRAEVATLMEASGYALRDGDPVTEAEAEEGRRRANAEVSKAEGSLETITASLAKAREELPPAVDPKEVRAQYAVVSAWESWKEHDRDRESYSANRRAYDHALETYRLWSKRHEALPKRPDPKELEAARKAAEAAEKEAAEARYAEERARRAVEAVPEDDVCGTCGRPGWEAAAKSREGLPALREALDEAAMKAREAASAYEEARGRLDSLRAAEEAFTAATKAIGEEPDVPAEPKAPTAPEEKRPERAEAEAADEAVRQADLDAAVRTRALRTISEGEEALKRAEKRLEALREEAARRDALVSAARKAPGVVAEKQLDALGDLGPVSLRFGDGTAASPAVTVLLDGRPWDLSSRGRQVVGDLWFRAGIRDALGTHWLQLWVDDVNAVGGQELPDVGGPLVLLRTTDEPHLDVSFDE